MKILGYARKATEEGKRRVALDVAPVEDLQKKFKADIPEACSTSDAKLRVIQDSQGKLLATVENITKFPDVFQTCS